MRLTILILTYNGKHHLRLLLPTVQELIRNTKEYTISVLIVDNGNDEDTTLFMKNEYPNFQYEKSGNNDYLFILNQYVKTIKSPYFLLLNDDMRLDFNLLNEAMCHFLNSKLFAVSCTIKNWDGNGIQEAVKYVSYKNAWMYIHKNDALNVPAYSFNACGGASVYRTNIFNELGGFDRLYYPAYYEDTDLSHRAWQSGYEIVNEPKAIVYHREGASWAEKKNNTKRTVLIYKNKMQGMVRNCSMPNFLLFFILTVPVRLLFGWRNGKEFYFAYVNTIIKLPKLLLLRKKQQKKIKISDSIVFRKIRETYER